MESHQADSGCVQHAEAPPIDPAALSPALLAAVLGSHGDGVLLVDTALRCRYANQAAAELAGCTRETLASCDLIARFEERDRADLVSQITGRSGRQERRTAVLQRPSGEEREVEYSVLHTTSHGEQLAVVLLRDVTETRQVLRWASALAQIAASVAYAESLDATLNTLARTVVRTTGTVACLIVVIDDLDQRSFAAAAAFGIPDDYIRGLQTVWRATGWIPAVEAIEHRQPFVYLNAREDILADPSCAPLHAAVRDASWDSLAAVPLIARGRPVGALTGYYRRRPAPAESEVAFLSSIADQAAIAVENTRLLIAAQGKAALEERQKLARELHDSVSQALYGIALGARTARELLQRDPPQAARPIEYVLSLAEAGLAEMRALIFELRPESLATEGLVAALTKQAAALRARHSLAVTTSFCDEPGAPLHVKEAAYRIAQEALHNVVRHARATSITLSIALAHDPSADRPLLTIEVCDDGSGFNTGDSFPGHLGLRSMRERATALGGALDVTSAPGQGTRILARIPLDP